MYEIIKSVIISGIYELSDILKKIDTIWVQGDISDEQRTELIDLAREKANVQNSVDLAKKIEELDKRVNALEQGSSDEPTEEYPEYVVGKWYYNGDKISFNGKNYVCIAPEGVVCVWNPDEYPAYWEEV